MRFRSGASLAILPPLLLSASCNWLTPLIFIGEHKKAISAEFDKLTNSRTAVLVWTDPSTMFDYPYARFELATYIGDKLLAELTQREQKLDMVDPRDVEDYITANPDLQVDPQRIGERFKTDYVVYVEILQFQFRDPDQPQLLQGKIGASVTVHDIRADADQNRVFELERVNCRHPENSAQLMTATNSSRIREATYRKFAEMVARKFYEYSEDL